MLELKVAQSKLKQITEECDKLHEELEAAYKKDTEKAQNIALLENDNTEKDAKIKSLEDELTEAKEKAIDIFKSTSSKEESIRQAQDQIKEFSSSV